MPSVDELLRNKFRLSQFRPHQRAIIDDALNGNDVLCVMPTGGGKSLCFQLPALFLDGLAVVVSPLIALMADQVQHLRSLNIPVLFLNSSQKTAEQFHVLAQLRQGFRGLLYMAPERFASPSFQRLMPQLRTRFFVVDEAHCLSFWGHDFRPEYMRLGEVRQLLGSPVTMALTATATPQVRRDIVEMLGLRSPRVHVTGFDRPNLAYSCRRLDSEAEKNRALVNFLVGRPGTGIVYCSTRRLVEQLAALLEERFPNRTVCAYHGGMDAVARKQSQESFMAGCDAIVVATNAFGMGINKVDIRFVVHYNIPASVEAYYQEAGRGGRDGQPAQCVLFCSPRDRHTQEFFIARIGDNNSALTPEQIAQQQNHARRQLDHVFEYGFRGRCRRRAILDYFGEATVITDCSCDVCQGMTLQSAAAPALKREYGVRHERVAGEHSAASSGGDSARPPKPPHDQTKTQRPRPLMEIPAKPRNSAPPDSGASTSAAALDQAAEVRFQQLKKVRMELASVENWPAFCICHDKVLREVARSAPNSLRSLAAIKGFGAKKAEKFGAAFLRALGQ